MAHCMIQDEQTNRETAIANLKTALTDKAKDLSKAVAVSKKHGVEIKGLQTAMTTVQKKVEETSKQQEAEKLANLEIKKELSEMVGNIQFPVKRTIVAQQVWYHDNEDLDKVASIIIHDGLNFTDVNIVRVERKSGRGRGTGLIKIELDSEESVKKVLKAKSKLKDSKTPELRDIYLRLSKHADVLKAGKNEDTILREMGVRNKYVRLSSGHLMAKQNLPAGGSKSGRYHNRSNNNDGRTGPTRGVI